MISILGSNHGAAPLVLGQEVEGLVPRLEDRHPPGLDAVRTLVLVSHRARPYQTPRLLGAERHPDRRLRRSGGAATRSGQMVLVLHAGWRSRSASEIVQCKRLADATAVGAPMLREFYGAFVADRSAVKGCSSQRLASAPRPASSHKISLLNSLTGRN